MKVTNARRGRAICLTLCLLSAATLAGCGQVGVSPGSTLTTGATGAGSAGVSVGAPTAPTISGAPAAQAMVGMMYSFQPSTSGASDKPLTFSITNKPSWATFNTSTGQLSAPQAPQTSAPTQASSSA